MSSIAVEEQVEELVGQAKQLVEDNIYFPGTTPLQQVGNYALGGGKRIRPSLSLALSRFYDLEDALSLPILLAVELSHTASLALDDLQDNDSERREKQTTHIRYDVGRAENVSHYLREQGVIVLQKLPQKYAGTIQLYSAETVQGICDGQDLDLHPPPETSLQSLQQTAHLKTGLGLEGSLWPITVLAEIEERDGNNIKKFAYHFGQVFQISDDMLDFYSGTGKDMGSDKRNGRETFLSFLGETVAKERLDMHVRKGVEILERVGDIPILRSMLQATATRSK